MWRDARVIPFLVYGFIVATCQTAQQQTLGFLIIDKLGVSPLAAQHPIAIAMAFGAVAGLLAQWGIIRMFEMTPRQLLRWGVGCAAVGNLVVALAPDYSTVVAGYAITSLGFVGLQPLDHVGREVAVGDQAAGLLPAAQGRAGAHAHHAVGRAGVETERGQRPLGGHAVGEGERRLGRPGGLQRRLARDAVG